MIVKTNKSYLIRQVTQSSATSVAVNLQPQMVEKHGLKELF